MTTEVEVVVVGHSEVPEEGEGQAQDGDEVSGEVEIPVLGVVVSPGHSSGGVGAGAGLRRTVVDETVDHTLVEYPAAPE